MISPAHSLGANESQPESDLGIYRSRDFIAETLISPSLLPMADLRLPAHEMKFLVTEHEAEHLERVLARSLMPDLHAQPDCGEGRYWTTTVYCDTPQFDVYFRQGRFRRRKFRLRRYGSDETIYLERKTKQGTQVRKQRSPIPLNDVLRLAQPTQDAVWDGDWFHNRVVKYGLTPTVALQYRRTAYCGFGENGPIRLTFDHDIAGRLADSWVVTPFEGGHSLYVDRVVCEMKFRGDLPSIFKTAAEELRLSPTGISKYRSCLASISDPSTLGGWHA